MERVPGRPIQPGFCLRTGKLETVESKEAVPTDFCCSLSRSEKEILFNGDEIKVD